MRSSAAPLPEPDERVVPGEAKTTRNPGSIAMHWIPLAIVTAAAFGLYNIFIKLSAGKIDEVLGAVILQVVAAIFGGAYAIYLHLSGHPFPISTKGTLFAVGAGAAIGVAEILTFVVYSKGAPASMATPLIMGGSILIAALIGLLALRESLALTQIFGVALVIAGVALISAFSPS